MRSRMSFLGAALLLTALWRPQPVHAASLRLDQAIERALSANAGLRAASHAVAAADGALRHEGAPPNPELSVLREGTHPASHTVLLSQTVENAGKRAARREVAQLDRAVASDAWLAKAAEIRSGVTAAYFEVLAAQEHAVLAQGALELALKARSVAARRVAAGKIAQLDATRASVAAATARLELAQAEAGLAGAQRRLAALWGATGLEGATLAAPDCADRMPSAAALLAALDDTPPLRQARRQADREAAQVRLELARRVPDFTLTVGAKKDEAAGRAQAVLGLSVPLPLFQRNQGNVVAAQQRAAEAQALAEQARHDTRLALAEAASRAQVAQLQVDALRNDMLPAARGALDGAVTGFELGKFTLLDVLDAQRMLAQVRAQYVDALSARNRAGAELRRFAAPDVERMAP